MLELFVQLIVSIFSVAALIMMNFTLFRIPVKGNHMQITVLAVVTGATNFYSKFVLLSDMYMVIQLLVYIITLALVRRYPIVYAAAVCGIGSIVASFCDALPTLAAVHWGLSDNDKMANNLLHFTVFHFLSAVLYLAIALLVKRRNWGFHFLMKRFDGRHLLKTRNYVWILVITMGTFVLQLANDRIIQSPHALILLAVALVFIGSILYAGYQNKKVMRDRYKHTGGEQFVGKQPGR